MFDSGSVFVIENKNLMSKYIEIKITSSLKTFAYTCVDKSVSDLKA